MCMYLLCTLLRGTLGLKKVCLDYKPSIQIKHFLDSLSVPEEHEAVSDALTNKNPFKRKFMAKDVSAKFDRV